MRGLALLVRYAMLSSSIAAAREWVGWKKDGAMALKIGRVPACVYVYVYVCMSV